MVFLDNENTTFEMILVRWALLTTKLQRFFQIVYLYGLVVKSMMI